MSQTTIINKFGKMQGWNSITINLLGRDVEGITQIFYNDSIEMENAYGGGMFPIGRGEGNYVAENPKLTLYKEEWDAIQSAIPPGSRVQEIEPFDAIVIYTQKSGRITKDIIRNCQFTGRGVEASQNDKTLTYEAELICSHVDWNVVI